MLLQQHPATVFAVVMTIMNGGLQPALAADSQAQALTYKDSQTQALDESTQRRQQWSLTEEQWTRYQTLLQGIRGSISPATISPIEVLGTHAETEQERRYYAELWARMRHEDAERILAFQQAYDEAFQKLYPHETLIDRARLPRPAANDQTIAEGDRLLVFLQLKHCPACDNLVQRIVHQAALKNHQLDLYFVDTQHQRDEGLIKQWAQQQNLNPQRLTAGTLTLNHDQGTYFKLTRQRLGPIPQVFKLHGKTLAALRL